MMLSCREAVRLISDGMDRRLPIWKRIGLRVHVLICTWCERYRRQLLFIRNAMRRHPDKLEGQDQPAAPSLSPEARERLKQALRRPQTG
jgi:hypothetical protein